MRQQSLGQTAGATGRTGTSAACPSAPRTCAGCACGAPGCRPPDAARCPTYVRAPSVSVPASKRCQAALSANAPCEAGASALRPTRERLAPAVPRARLPPSGLRFPAVRRASVRHPPQAGRAHTGATHHDARLVARGHHDGRQHTRLRQVALNPLRIPRWPRASPRPQRRSAVPSPPLLRAAAAACAGQLPQARVHLRARISQLRQLCAQRVRHCAAASWPLRRASGEAQGKIRAG